MSKTVHTSKSPQLLDSDWVEKLNFIARSHITDEISLRRIELDIQLTLSKAKDVLVKAVCHQCLGTIASIRGKSNELISEYEKALSLVVNRGLQMNYSVDLRRANCFRQLRGVNNMLFNNYPDDPQVLREALRSFTVLGDFLSVDAVYKRLVALNKADDHTIEINPVFVKNFVEKAASRGVSSEKISYVFDTALKVIEDQGFFPVGTGFCFDTDDCSTSLRFMIESTSDQRALLGSRIADAIVSEHDDDLSDLISFGVMAPRGEAVNAF